MRLRPTSRSECLHPDLSPVTSYGMRCRCDRCREGKREYQRRYNQVKQKIVCDRCDRRGEIQVRDVELCGACVTDADRYRIWEDTFRGRFGSCGE